VRVAEVDLDAGGDGELVGRDDVTVLPAIPAPRRRILFAAKR
jgi:hypothetical protein